MNKGLTYGSVLLLTLLMLASCGGSSSAPPSYGAAQAAPQGAPAYGPGDADMAAEAPAMEGEDGAMGAGPAASGAEKSAPLEPAKQPTARPGLGTAWGENRQSRTTEGAFERANPSRPFAVASLWYNDRQGARAMAGSSDYRAHDQLVVPTFRGGVTVHLQGEHGEVLPGFQAGGKQYVIGEAGRRYTIVVRNYSDFRFEVVASVDGLDVIDGRTAGYSKRGYILAGRSTLEIEGFRRSADTVAAFRFSAVRESYSARTGKGDRNVGVIGVALFHERNTSPVWTQQEIHQRHQADPFPGR